MDSAHKATDLADEYTSCRGGKEEVGKLPVKWESVERYSNWGRSEHRENGVGSKPAQMREHSAKIKERENWNEIKPSRPRSR